MGNVFYILKQYVESVLILEFTLSGSLISVFFLKYINLPPLLYEPATIAVLRPQQVQLHPAVRRLLRRRRRRHPEAVRGRQRVLKQVHCQVLLARPDISGDTSSLNEVRINKESKSVDGDTFTKDAEKQSLFEASRDPLEEENE